MDAGVLIRRRRAGKTLPPLVIVTQPSLDTPNLKVGATLASCAIAGAYTWPGGPVTESWSWLVDGAVKAGSYVIAAGDAQIEAYVTLSATGLPSQSPVHLGPVPVTNTAPVAVGGALHFTVPASGPAPTYFTTAASAPFTYFKDTVNWPTTGGLITIATDLSVAALSGTQYLYEMDSHISLQVVADGRLFLSIKDGANTAVIMSVVIGTIAAGTRYDIIVAVDLVALTAWTTINGVTTTRTLGANSGNLASASRRLCLLARAGGTTNNLLGTIYKLEVWQDCVSGGGRPASDTNLRTNGRIVPPASAANAHPWKNGNPVT